MDFNRLEKNLFDNIFEAQLKLGYDQLPLSLNYMYGTLRNLLGTDSDHDTDTVLHDFVTYAEPRLGKISLRGISGGICITIPPEGTAYVHENAPADSFIAELVSLLREHGISAEDVLALFRKYSDNVHIEDKSSSGEFDILAYFEDGIPDDYRYCLSVEDDILCCHISYHRFIPEDYEVLGF